MKTVYTGEDLQRLHIPGHWELVRGALIEMTPPGWEHGEVQVNLSALLKSYTRRVGGRVAVESGFFTERQPDTVRGPDVAYYAPGRLEAAPVGFCSIPPDLVAEIVSPNDLDIEAKVREYLAAGVSRVWVLYPRTRTLYAYGPGGEARRLQSDDVLTDPEALPGFELPVDEVFEGL